MTQSLNYSATEAKAKFAELLDHVERGATVRITRRGRPIASVQQHNPARTEEVAETLRQIHELAKGVKQISIEEILSARHEGHKY